MMSENGSPRHSPHRNKWEQNYTLDLTVNNNVFVACKETRREADSKISGQRHQDRNIHRKDLQQNVNISANDNTTAGGGLSQGTYSESFMVIPRVIFDILRRSETGTLSCLATQNPPMEVL